MSEYNEEYQRLIRYSQAAEELAQCMLRDIKKGKKYTNATVLALSQFTTESHAFQKLLDQVEAMGVSLN